MMEVNTINQQVNKLYLFSKFSVPSTANSFYL
ncbi:MAG: hypothetical protein ACFWT6_07660 [Virgibacillus proomii]